MNKKLCKSSTNRMLAGVCGGIGTYLNIDATIIRLIWALLSLSSCGSGILIYIIATLIIPDDEIIQ